MQYQSKPLDIYNVIIVILIWFSPELAQLSILQSIEHLSN